MVLVLAALLVAAAAAGVATRTLVLHPAAGSGDGEAEMSVSNEPAPAGEAEAQPTDGAQPTETSQPEGGARPNNSSRPEDGTRLANGSRPTAETHPLRAMLDAGEVSSIELVGDSITAGYGTDGYTMPGTATGTQAICTAAGTTYYETPDDVRCWANDFRAYAAERGVKTFTNRGICGWTMHDLATYGPDYVTQADVIVCMLGTNDTVNHPLDTFREDARTALALLADRCRLLVVMTPPQTDWTRSGYAAYFTPQDTAEVLDQVCDEAGYLHISNLDVIGLDSDLVNADDVHPTTKGSDAIWANMEEQLGLV